MPTCSRCGGEIEFCYIDGRCIPLHFSGGCGGAARSEVFDYPGYRRSKEGSCFRTKCPKCKEGVYFIRHNGGSVWIDPPLGPPWYKHPCMDDAYVAAKVAAKRRLDETAPLDHAVNGSGLGEAILAVFRATNLLSPFEKVRLRDVLRGPAADDFVRAAARFTLGEGRPALLDVEHALKAHDCAKWTGATYLPFLWRPEAHMFLKPEVTKDFAARGGHRFTSDYEPRLEFAVYESLLYSATIWMRTARRSG